MRLRDLSGQRFGRLVVIARSESDDKHTRWLCRCDCGTETVAFGCNLTRHLTSSCGCLAREMTSARLLTHGQAGTLDYARWRSMLQRCDQPSAYSFRFYGARGVKVCARWRTFAHYFQDMGPAPAGMTLDRIDNDKGYGPDNCRWASPSAQANHRRSNRLLTCRGETRTIAQWARELRLSYGTIKSRLVRGWTAERALTVPPRANRRAA